MKVLSILVLPIIFFASCKKEKAPSWTGCRVKEVKKTVTDALLPGTANYTFTYNDEGKVQQITLSGTEMNFNYNATRVFKYTANTIEILSMSDKNIMSVDSLELDAQGRIAKIFSKRSNGIVESYWREYTYDSEGQVELFKYHSGSSITVDSAFWDNGNMVRYNPNSWGSDYVYSYCDTAYNIGIISASLDDFITYGRAIFKVNRAERSKYNLAYKHTEYIRSYTLDTDGKILSIIQDGQGAGITTWKIGYDCR